MASNAMSLSSDSDNPEYRPPLLLTPLGFEAAREIPPLDVLLKRKGTKGLQQCVDELTYLYFQKHGWDWIYANAKVFTQHKLYFLQLSDQVHYLGSFRKGLNYLMDAVEKGSYNHALRRAR